METEQINKQFEDRIITTLPTYLKWTSHIDFFFSMYLTLLQYARYFSVYKSFNVDKELGIELDITALEPVDIEKIESDIRQCFTLSDGELKLFVESKNEWVTTTFDSYRQAFYAHIGKFFYDDLNTIYEKDTKFAYLSNTMRTISRKYLIDTGLNGKYFIINGVIYTSVEFAFYHDNSSNDELSGFIERYLYRDIQYYIDRIIQETKMHQSENEPIVTSIEHNLSPVILKKLGIIKNSVSYFAEDIQKDSCNKNRYGLIYRYLRPYQKEAYLPEEYLAYQLIEKAFIKIRRELERLSKHIEVEYHEV